MRPRFVILLSLGVAVCVYPSLADTVSCTPSSSQTECRGNFTCSTMGFCSGEPINENQECTMEATSGGCMTVPFCHHGVCTGTVPVDDGTPCSFPGLGTCYAPGHCMKLQFTNISICMGGTTPKTCDQPSDPCKQSFCNPQTGNCETGDRCFTFGGCETCSNGLCQPTRLGQACTDPQGDFNECTKDDKCVLEDIGGGQMRGLCMGVPLSGPGPTPTMGPTLCDGDCNFDGQTTVDELETMARVLLGEAPLSLCLLGDANHNGRIDVEDIVAGVESITSGCHS